MKPIIVLLLLAIGILPAQAATVAPGLSKLKPIIACNLLRDTGLGGRNWRNDYDDVYGCSSPYKDIGSGYPLTNNLAYYVDGKAKTVSQLKLVLNINVRAQAQSAHTELLRAADLLTKKALGAELPSSIRTAITVGKSASAKVVGASVKVTRLNWPTGRGYEIQF